MSILPPPAPVLDSPYLLKSCERLLPRHMFQWGFGRSPPRRRACGVFDKNGPRDCANNSHSHCLFECYTEGARGAKLCAVGVRYRVELHRFIELRGEASERLFLCPVANSSECGAIRTYTDVECQCAPRVSGASALICGRGRVGLFYVLITWMTRLNSTARSPPFPRKGPWSAITPHLNSQKSDRRTVSPT